MFIPFTGSVVRKESSPPDHRNNGPERTVPSGPDAGKAGVEGIHAYIDKGIPPPNRPITLSGGWMRNPVSKKPVKVKGKSGTTPLVDTGQLHNDFDFAIAGK